VKFPPLAYISWAKASPRAAVNLARSGVEPCPVSLLGLKSSDLVAALPVTYGYQPLKEAIGRRYGVAANRVFPVSGGTSFANWVACAAVLDGCGSGAEVIVERPGYEPLAAIPRALGCRVRRFERRFSDRYELDVDRVSALVTERTRLVIVTNLHNPSGVRIPMPALRALATMLARVGAFLLVDEVYLECAFGARAESCVHAGPNVLTTNSLTKAYGLDGLRAGWILGPPAIIARAGRINDLMTNNSVAPGEQMTLAAFKRHAHIDRRAHGLLDANLARIKAFFSCETRLQCVVPEFGGIAFPRLPRGIDGDRFGGHLLRRYSTLVVPGRFFEAPQHVRVSFGGKARPLARGLESISRALDDLT
jgi:aspartate/methionine/tyrosine aminotransferase